MHIYQNDLIRSHCLLYSLAPEMDVSGFSSDCQDQRKVCTAAGSIPQWRSHAIIPAGFPTHAHSQHLKNANGKEHPLAAIKQCSLEVMEYPFACLGVATVRSCPWELGVALIFSRVMISTCGTRKERPLFSVKGLQLLQSQCWINTDFP